MIENINTLRQMKSLKEIVKSDYYQREFVDKYMNDIPRLAHDLFGIDLTWQQEDVVNSFSFLGGRVVVASGHSCMGEEELLMVKGKSYPTLSTRVRVGDKLRARGGYRIVEDIKYGEDRMYRITYEDGHNNEYTSLHTLILSLDGEEIEVQTESYFQNQHKYKYAKAIQLLYGNEKLLKIKDIKFIGVQKYVGIMVDGDNKFYDYFGVLTSNTGKTKLLSIIATAFILLFPKSLVRIQAPTDAQVTKFSFKEISDNLSKLRSKRKINGRMVESKWSFLVKHIVITKTLIYVKGFQTSWYIEPKSAPIGKSENLSGQHNEYYLLIFDEMSGIEDDHITASLGGTSDPINCAIGFSQHTRKSGKFNDFMTTQSVDNGGVWIPHILNSEESPRVGVKEIKSWRATYNDNEYSVRVKGLPPIFSEGNLLDNDQVAKIYTREGKDWIEKIKFKTRVLSGDTSFTGQRDKGVISASRVANIIDDKGISKLYIILDDIQIPKRKVKSPIKPYRYLKPFELKDEMLKQVFLFMQKDTECDRTKVAWDRNSGGDEAYYKLEEQLAENGNGEIEAYGIAWGSTDDMRKAERKKFLNQKAKCYSMLKEIIEDDRFYCSVEKYRQLLSKEAENLPFEMTTDNFKFKMVGKEKLRKLNISSPDIMDTIAQMLLMYFPEESIEENQLFTSKDEDLEELSADDFDDDFEEDSLEETHGDTIETTLIT